MFDILQYGKYDQIYNYDLCKITPNNLHIKKDGIIGQKNIIVLFHVFYRRRLWLKLAIKQF